MHLGSQDSQGKTPLHYAVRYKENDDDGIGYADHALGYILSWNPPLDVKDSEGNTPLHLAVETAFNIKNFKPAHFLIYHGAKWDIQNENGQTAQDIAESLEEGAIKDQVL